MSLDLPRAATSLQPVLPTQGPLRRLFSFPNPVNEKAARSVAGLVVLLAIATLVTRSELLLWILTLGFLARVATGPSLSVFGQLATRVIAPRLGPAKLVPGPPKRFAQAMGFTMTTAALVLQLTGVPVLPWVLVGLVVVAAVLESVFAICLGCIVFGRLQLIGLIPDSVCEACAPVRR